MIKSAQRSPSLRKNSSRKIIIASPSEEIMRFLSIPNPAADSDPRERLHILTPKTQKKSEGLFKITSNKSAVQIKGNEERRHLKLVRKWTSQKCAWRKMDLEFQQNNSKSSKKNTIKMSVDNQQIQNLHSKGGNNLDYTFGLSRLWPKLQV